MEIKVVIIGGDEKAVMLLEALRGIKGVEIVGACDTAPDSAGMRYARKLGIDTSSELAGFISEKGADIIIDACGSSESRKALSLLPAGSAKIIDAKTAQLLFSIVQEKEKELEQIKSEFISTTSHELRTPLAAIKESVMLVIDGTTGPVSGKQGRFLKIARRNIERLAVLINGLLDLSRIESGRMEIKKSACDIEEIIEKALGPMRALARDKKLILKEEYGKGLPKVNCDPQRIIQVIANLVGNAVKFTPSGGKVTVSCVACCLTPAVTGGAKAAGAVKISVADTGVGIDKDDMPRLFTKFGQLDGSLTRRPGSTGLGLAICKELLALHGGEIWAESEPGKGSTFNFTLPAEGS